MLARAQAVSWLLIDLTQVTDAALTFCAAALSITVIEHPSIAASDTCISTVISAMSGIIKTGRQLPASIYPNISIALGYLNSQSQGSLSVGEQSLSIVSTAIRVTSQVLYAHQLENTTFEPASTDFEKALRFILTSVNLLHSIANSTGVTAEGKYDPVGVSLTFFTVNPHRPSEGSANPTSAILKLHVGYQGTSSFTSNYYIVLQNSSPLDYTNYPATNHSYRCVANSKPVRFSAYNVSVICTGSNHRITCPGDRVINLKYTCPARHLEPSCNIWNSADNKFEKPSYCTVVAYSAWNTTCLCTGFFAYQGRRALAESKAAIEVTTSGAVLADRFVNTLETVNKLNATTVGRNYVSTLV